MTFKYVLIQIVESFHEFGGFGGWYFETRFLGTEEKKNHNLSAINPIAANTPKESFGPALRLMPVQYVRKAGRVLPNIFTRSFSKN